jgi:uncharacterized protein (TIGR04255 family)
MVTVKEVYPCAPLRLVSLELKFPVTSRVLGRQLWDELEFATSMDLPDVTISSSEPESHVPEGHYDSVLRRMSEDRKRAVTVYTGAITIELADYLLYEDLKGITERVLGAVQKVENLSLPYTRVGLRYINEITADSIGILEDQWHRSKSWTPFLNEQLLGSIESPPDGLCAYAQQSSAFFHSTEGSEYVSLAYGISSDGLVDPRDVLILDGNSGPCFILDLDAFQAGTIKEPVASESAGIMKTLDKLHNFVEYVFQWSITDQSREVFRARSDKPSDKRPSPT